ncbi:MAG: DUF2461 family protein [Anaerolineae bacterium]|nr:DUF2461 family protein [Anaerolineae bacterium]
MDSELNNRISPENSFTIALAILRRRLQELGQHDKLRQIEAGREDVYARYGQSFKPDNLPHLTADEYLSFLSFENNHHWTNINRYGTRTVKDMDALRAGLTALLDESRPIAERYDALDAMRLGIARAIATPILHVAYPQKYGVWNSKSGAGLKELNLMPAFPRGTTDGQKYETINKVLLDLAGALEIDLWTLDTLWDMADLTPYISELLELVRVRYPGWSDFNHEQFVADEIDYKREAAAFSREQLAKESLQALLDAGDTDGFIARLKAVANKTNLLYKGTPSTSDLAIINQPDADLRSICEAIFELLHGGGDAADRLGVFFDFVSANELPRSWTFPTYYLFLLYPEREMFIKPTVMRWLAKFTKGQVPYQSKPSAPVYEAMRAGIYALRDALLEQLGLPDTTPDMIEMQSFVYVASSIYKEIKKLPLGAPFDRIFTDWLQAEGFFILMAQAVELLGGGPDDLRFALTLPHDGTMVRLNMGNTVVMDFADRGKTMHMAALVDEVEQVPGLKWVQDIRVTAKGTDKPFAFYALSPELIEYWPAELEAAFEDSMREYAKEFAPWQQSNLLRAHRKELFEALFDEDKRFELLTNGLPLPVTDGKMTATPSPTPPSNGSIARQFQGFTTDAFAFMADLMANNNKPWMDANRERWHSSVFEPMRSLFTDLGPSSKVLFDPYLSPHALEIAPTTRAVLARINKNWGATPDSQYYSYYWGSFFREGLSRQTDAQLYVTIFSHQIRAGFSFGQYTKAIRSRFRERVSSDPGRFYELYEKVALPYSIQFGWTNQDGIEEIFDVRSTDDLNKWLESDDLGFLHALTPEEAVAQGPALADTVFDTFRRVFPFYLWAMHEGDDYDTVVDNYLETLIVPEPGEDEDEPEPTPYTFDDFLASTILTHERASELLDMLHDKGQAIFYGPPGTGKTYVARHLGRLLTGLADPPDERLTVVQFHPAYSYEEFMEGIRVESKPDGDGRSAIHYPVKEGMFVRFCRRAAQLGDKPCVFIIDEINRGNIARIFGELMYLLEYRDDGAPLAYSGKPFRIPRNVYVIGTMNTADRSIALVDFALRRRFHFARFTADPDLFEHWLDRNPDSARVPWLGALYHRLTDEAIEDEAYRIGPSVFMRTGLDEAGVRRVWQWNVMPYLREYYFDNLRNAERWAWDGELLRGIRGVNGG